MALSNSKNQSNKPEDLDLLKSDIASFASSLGLASSVPSSQSGFNDADFRKTGRLQTNKPHKKERQAPNAKSANTQKPLNQNSKPNEKPKPKPPVLSLDDSGDKPLGFEKFKNMPKLPLMKASGVGVWYLDAEELEPKVIGKKGMKVEVKNVEDWKKVVEKKRELAERLMAQYVKDYESSRGQSGDIKMLIATQRSGTATDKVSAFSVLVGDNPMANLRSIDALLGMVTSKVGKRHALTGFEALKELFVSSLLPDRKLKNLLQRPLNHLPETKDGYSLLLFWYWEECLKHRYERFIFALEEASRDMLPILKDKSLKIIYTLLKSKSEQERRLLSALVNKLGDPENKSASNADYHLSKILSDHPNMTVVVIDEVDSFLFRPHLVLRAKYHAVNFLSQIRLTHKGDGPNVAKRLIDVYFALFKVLITEAGIGHEKDKSDKQGDGKASKSDKHGKAKNLLEAPVELDSRLLSVLLTGVNRAFPYVLSTEADDIIETQTPMLFQLVHSNNFNVGVQALMLLDKISSKNQVVSDRFYRALYAKLLLPAAMNSSKAEMFIGLLLRAMKSDVNLKRVAAFAKRVMQVALQQPPQYACGCLFLLSEVLKARPPLWNLVLQNESVDEEEEEHFEDIVEEPDNKPTSPSETQEKKVDNVVSGDAAVADSDNDSSDDEKEAPLSSEDEHSDEAEDFLVRDDPEDRIETVPGSGGQQSQAPPSVTTEKGRLPGGYNPRHREPSYCNADRVSWWELTALASHVHPSVSKMATTLLFSGTNIVYNGNPLNDLSLTAFLDKFMEKKPKSSTWHGGSQIEPAKKLEMNDQLIGSDILSLAEDDVPPEDLVFHKFYMNKMSSSKRPKKKKKKRGADDDDAEALFDVDGGGDNDDSDNEEIDNMLDSGNLSGDLNMGDYDYDDLDQVAEEDDEDLVGNGSDEDPDMLSDIAEGEDFDIDDAAMENASDDDEDDDDDDIIEIGDVDDSENDEDVDEVFDQRKTKGKRKLGKSGASPFASYEEYEHLLNEEDASLEDKEPSKKKGKKSSKSRKKRKSSE